MKVVNISKKRFSSLEPCRFDDVNTEGVIYNFSYHGHEKLLKKLYVSDGITLAKKLFTIEVLNSNSLPSYFIVPDSLVSVNNKVVGFTIPSINGVTLKNLLNDKDFPIQGKIGYLKSVGSILEKMVSIRNNTELRHFYLNDMHESNFMISYDTSDLCIIDLDGCKISSSFSFPARYLTMHALLNNIDKYNVEPDLRHGAYVMANQDSDLYCYIIIILNYLYGENINNLDLASYYEYLNYLEDIGINMDLINSFVRIISHGSNINPMCYLDSLTDEQICRAKKKVYKIVKK